MSQDGATTEELTAILARLAQMQATLDAQQATIARQQAAIAALQQDRGEWPALVTVMQRQGAERAASASAASALTASQEPGKRGKVGRRSLLAGAAGVAGATVATAAVVAVGNSQTAHAASAATGDTLILGQSNDAGAPTILTNTTGTTGNVLEVTATEFGASGISALSGATYVNNSTGPAAATSYPSGVLGQSDTGIGVVGGSSGFIDLAAIGSGRILQLMRPFFGAPTGTGYIGGESIRDVYGDLWLCTGLDTSGNPVWAKVALLAPGATVGGAITYLSKPIRLLDTRVGATDANQLPNAQVSSTTPFRVYVAGITYNGVNVPRNTLGAIGNVTVVAGPTANGYLELVPAGAGFTGAANLAFGPNQVVSNAFNVGLSSSNSLVGLTAQPNGMPLTGMLDIIIGGSSVDVIVDLFAVVTGIAPALGVG